MNKPIKCWNCLFLGNCNNYCENGCDKFFDYKIRFDNMAKLLNINVRTLYRWFAKDKEKSLNKIYNTIGLKVKFVKHEKKSYLIINKE